MREMREEAIEAMAKAAYEDRVGAGYWESQPARLHRLWKSHESAALDALLDYLTEHENKLGELE